ncbi:MAG: 3-phosphoserine/phosphohydroxythreonine transaminase [Candidatus Brocadiia bacterium]
MRAYNFFAGPAVLPVEVLNAAAAAVHEFNGMGVSILEVSHRDKAFEAVLNEAIADLKSLVGIPDNYKVLFLTGGASTQFAMVPMNFLPKDGYADYVDTGTWSSKAIKEAKLFGKVNVVASSKEATYNHIPKGVKFAPGAAYAHITSNNTIYGSEWHYWPESGDVPLICDMSSDIMARKIDAKKFAMIYAGAQKNMGPAGVTLTIIREDLFVRTPASIPTMLKYTTHVEENSLYNTPPVYAILVVREVLRWLKGLGGVEEIEKRNRRKAGMLYEVLDKHPIYKPHIKDPNSRSLMNVTWRCTDEPTEEALLAEAKKMKMLGLKGHRSVGGLRASIYNACPEESVKVLCDLLEKFAASHK